LERVASREPQKNEKRQASHKAWICGALLRACLRKSVQTMGDRGSTKVALTDSTTEWDEILINKGILSRDEVLRNKGVDPDEIRLKQAIVSIRFTCASYIAQQQA
jgi:hypothetical protein